jgi:rod shape-determining protein MreB
MGAIKNFKENYYKQKKLNRNFISMDLGTANTLIFVSGKGIIFNERSILAYSTSHGKKELLSVGNKAFEMVGKGTRGITLVEPLLGGVINDLGGVKDMIIYAFEKLSSLNILHDSILLLACPSKVTQLEMKALKDIGYSMGAKYVFVEEEVKMAAVGGGIDIAKPEGNLVVDIGGGTTDIAVVSSGDVVLSKSIKEAGNFFTHEIIKFIKQHYGLAIGFKMGEDIKIQVGSTADSYQGDNTYLVYGRDLSTGLPREVEIRPKDIRHVLDEPLRNIVLTIKRVLEETPPELLIDIARNGITLVGGGALISGLERYIGKVFSIPCKKGRDPLLAVINGTVKYEAKALELIELEEEFGTGKKAHAIQQEM